MSRVGIIGCGNIAPAYAKTLGELGWVEIVGFADGIPGRAEDFAERFGGRAMTVSELLGSDVDAVVNLTPAQAHTAVTRSILEAGKHAFSEKPLGTDFDEGAALVALAQERGLRLGCAPDTFLGAGLQSARDAIERGVIGEPLGANAFFLGAGPERWHPNPEIFYGPGAGPLFDMGPYYFTALTQLLGPATSIVASARIGKATRVIGSEARAGETFTATVPTHTTSVVTFGSGATATLVTSFDVPASRYRNLEIYGTEATLSVPDPNMFGGPLTMRAPGAEEWTELPLRPSNVPQSRGIGLADMLSAQTNGRAHRASGDLALHVLELMSSTVASSVAGRRLDLTTTFERQPLLDGTLPANTFD